jgi:hypothetical protein
MRRHDLVADCGSCAALCCVATSFERSEDFAYDKPASVRCTNLTASDRCAIHTERVERGFVGCTLYDCYGAGQRATRDYARDPSARDRAFLALREVHELLFLLTEAAALCPASEATLRAQLDALVGVLDALGGTSQLALAEQRAAAHALLRRVGDALGGRRDGRRLPVL